MFENWQKSIRTFSACETSSDEFWSSTWKISCNEVFFLSIYFFQTNQFLKNDFLRISQMPFRPIKSYPPLLRAWSQVGRLALSLLRNHDSGSSRLVTRAPHRHHPVITRAPPRPPQRHKSTTSSSRTCERNPPDFISKRIDTRAPTHMRVEEAWNSACSSRTFP